ncbi:solute carrier family 35 member G2-like [Glandiceps talaboti]
MTLLEKFDEFCEKKCYGNVQWRTVVSVIAALISGVSHAVAGAFAVLVIGAGISEFQVLFLVAVCVSFTMVIILRIQDESLLVKDARTNVLLFVNGILLFIGDTSYVYAVVWAPLGNVTTIINAVMPILTALTACIVIKERWKPIDAVCTVINVTGIVFITCPTFIFRVSAEICPSDCTSEDLREESTMKYELIAYGLAVVCAACYSLSPVCVRAINTDVNVSSVVLYQGAISTILDFFLMYIVGKPQWRMNAETGALLFGVIMFDMFELWLCFYSLQTEEAATVVLLSNVEVVMAYILSFFLLLRGVTILEIIGAVLVIFSTAVVGISACCNSKQKDEEEEEKTFLSDSFH